MTVTAVPRGGAVLWFRAQLLGNVSDDVLDRRDIILFVVTRGVVALVENGAQLLCLVSGCLKRPHWSRADSDEVLTVVYAIDENE
ncbi:MAG: hypothetical protein WAR76_07665 [Xanthobacteraceae bacterium]